MTASAASTSATTTRTTTATTFLTRSKLFQRLTRWAFSVCDVDGTGHVNKDELYAGILLVHLQLAKYTGSAACYPPTRRVIEQLFEASDDDQSGFIDETEFTQIMVICCAQIMSRILVYYGLIILLVPRMASSLIATFASFMELWSDGTGITTKLHSLEAPSSSVWSSAALEKLTTVLSWGRMAEQAVSLALFFLVIPLLFDWIDQKSGNAATNYVVPSVGCAGANNPMDKND